MFVSQFTIKCLRSYSILSSPCPTLHTQLNYLLSQSVLLNPNTSILVHPAQFQPFLSQFNLPKPNSSQFVLPSPSCSTLTLLSQFILLNSNHSYPSSAFLNLTHPIPSFRNLTLLSQFILLNSNHSYPSSFCSILTISILIHPALP